MAINVNKPFELSQKRYEDSVKNYVTNWTQNSTSANQFSNVLQTQIDARNEFTGVKSETRHIQIQPLDTSLSFGSVSIPFQGTSMSSMPVTSTNNSSSVTQPNTLSISASTTEDSQTQNIDLIDQSTVAATTENSTKMADLSAANLYSYLTGEETPSNEDTVTVDSILNRLSSLTSTQSGSLFTQSNSLSSLQSAASSTGVSESSLSALAALNGESSIQALLKTVYGGTANNDFNI